MHLESTLAAHMPHVTVQTHLEPILEQKSSFQRGGGLGKKVFLLLITKVTCGAWLCLLRNATWACTVVWSSSEMSVKVEFLVFLGNEESEAGNHP